MEFKLWLENQIAKRTGIKDTILKFLKSKLNISDDATILNMRLGSIDRSVVSDLMSRGLVSTADENVLSDIRNGSITVGALVDRLAGMSSPSGSQAPDFVV
jgi:hypothetical protein